MPRRPSESPATIRSTRYLPPGGFPLDVEVKRLALGAGRATLALPQVPERTDFHELFLVEKGRLRHQVDFAPVDCPAGSLLLVRAGQVQQWNLAPRCSGWLVLFRAGFVRSRPDPRAVAQATLFESLPARLDLGPERAAVAELIARMAKDSHRAAGVPERHALLRAQLESLLLRLRLCAPAPAAPGAADAEVEWRFQRFSRAVEERFTRHRDVGHYARLLRCSQRTLTRTCQRAAGASAKELLARRVALEARRLLAHTALAVGEIAGQLGFAEATNFGKFFLAQEGCTPGAFRARHR